MQPWMWIVLGIVGLLVLIGLYDVLQKKHAILRNFPIIGHFRYLIETIGAEQEPVECGVSGAQHEGCVIQAKQCAVIDNAPSIDDRDSTTQHLGFLQIVCGQDHGSALLIDFLQQRPGCPTQIDNLQANGLLNA